MAGEPHKVAPLSFAAIRHGLVSSLTAARSGDTAELASWGSARGPATAPAGQEGAHLRKPSMPAAMHSTRSRSEALAVMATIGVSQHSWRISCSERRGQWQRW